MMSVGTSNQCRIQQTQNHFQASNKMLQMFFFEGGGHNFWALIRGCVEKFGNKIKRYKNYNDVTSNNNIVDAKTVFQRPLILILSL